MAPSFFSKLTRPSNSSNATSGESSPRGSHSRSSSIQRLKTVPASIRITPALDLTPTPDAAQPDDVPSDGGSSLNVNVIPPSPSVSTQSEFKNEDGSSDSRQSTTSLTMPPGRAQPPMPKADGELTPMPPRSDSTPLRHAQSTGSLKKGGQPDSPDGPGNKTAAHQRYATLATPQPSNSLSKRASKSSLIIETPKEKRVTSSPSDPLVDSPTSPTYPVQTITKSFTTNTVPANVSNTFLSPKQKDSDTASIRSVSSSRSRSFFSGGTFDSIKKTSSKSPKRKPTGLASAIAISGLTVAMSPQSELAEHLREASADKGHTRNRSLSSAGRHDKLPSSLELPGNGSGNRSRAPSFVQPSEYSSGTDESDEDSSDDVDDVTADLMPVTGFAVASSKRNADFHELFPDIPEGDYLIEGVSKRRFVNVGP